MGKALVIKNINVENPLTKVTFINADYLVEQYATKNNTATTAEIEALSNFVNGLQTKNLLNKMRYFYPMLGNDVADLVIELIEPDTEDLFNGYPISNMSLSVSDRTLVTSTPTSRASSSTLTRFKATDWRNFGMVTATQHNSNKLGGSVALYFNGQTGNYSYGFNNLSDSVPERWPRLRVGYDGSNSILVPGSDAGYPNIQSYTDRIIFGQVKGNTSSELYKDNSLYASGLSYMNDIQYISAFRLLAIGSSDNVKYKFMAITDILTSNEWGEFYSLLTVFLQAVGKRQA